MVRKSAGARRIEVTVNDGDLDLLTVNEAAAVLKVGRSSIYKLIRDGALATVMIGASRRVRRADLADYIESLRQSVAT